MAIVSFELAEAGGAAIVAVKRMAHSASDRRKDNLIIEKDGLPHSQISARSARMSRRRWSCEKRSDNQKEGTFNYS
jgi:hypothetical protein